LAELRWILLGLTLVLLAGIWWWGMRQSRQAPGNAQLRETPADNTVVPVPAAAPYGPEPPALDDDRDWGVPPFEPLSIRTAELKAPALDKPMTSTAAAVDLGPEPPPAPAAAPPIPAPAAPMVAPPAPTPTPAPAAPAAASNTDAGERQRIVTIRVCALGETRWPGTDLMAALEQLGLAHGRYQVYHRNHADGRSLFCVASLVEPGTFDLARMPQEEFRGVTLFAVLPGPIEPLQTIDALFATARGLAERLSGMVQDTAGMPFSPQRTAALREDVARFQAS
jgi:FtsZ-interacting cell division protein ZipA